MLIACDLVFSFVRSLFRWLLRLVVLCLSGCSTPGPREPTNWAMGQAYGH